MTVGRKQVYNTPEEYEDAKKRYNKRYYEKKSDELKQKRLTDKIITYTDEELKLIIANIGWERILKLMI